MSDYFKSINGKKVKDEGVRNALQDHLNNHPTQDLSGYATKDEVRAKQDKLVSGNNIKTINGNSILGNGDIAIEVNSVPSMTKGSFDDALNISKENPNCFTHIVTNNFFTKPIFHIGDSVFIDSLGNIIDPKSRWKGKTINILGDSITAGGSFFGKLGQLTGATLKNYGVGSTHITGTFIERAGQMDVPADLVMVFGGTNDYWHKNANIGTIDDPASSRTFYGAMKNIQGTLEERYPDGEYLWVFPYDQHFFNVDSSHDYGKGSLNDFREAMRNFTTVNNLKFLDLGNPVYGFDWTKHTSDGVHANGAGGQIIADAMYEFISWNYLGDNVITGTPNIPVTPTYTITYNINGYGSQPKPVTNVLALPSSLPVLTASGYTFEGWFTDSGLTKQAIPGSKISANTTLYAKWTVAESPDTGGDTGEEDNGGDDSSNSTGYRVLIPHEEFITGAFYDNEARGHDINVPMTTGSYNVFKCHQQMRKTNNEILVKITGTDTSSIKLCWATYNDAENDQTGSKAIISLDENGEWRHTFSSKFRIDVFNYPGSRFTALPEGTVITVYEKVGEGDALPEVPSTPTYTVTYNTNGKGTQPPQVTGVTKLPNPLPTLYANGYTFGGWYTNSALTTSAVAGATISSNTTLYAKWTAIESSGDSEESSDVPGYRLLIPDEEYIPGCFYDSPSKGEGPNVIKTDGAYGHFRGHQQQRNSNKEILVKLTTTDDSITIPSGMKLCWSKYNEAGDKQTSKGTIIAFDSNFEWRYNFGGNFRVDVFDYTSGFKPFPKGVLINVYEKLD